jgi:hypothetical protein
MRRVLKKPREPVLLVTLGNTAEKAFSTVQMLRETSPSEHAVSHE